MGLIENQDYVFFPKAHVIENRLTAKMSDACFLGTRRYIFIVPKRSIQSYFVATRITQYNEGVDPAEALQSLLAEGELSVEELEAELTERLADDREVRVFAVQDLETFEMKTGFWGQTKLKAPGDKVKLVNIRGKGNKARAKAFYEHCWAVRG
jgi:hypothetical protein